MRPDLHVNPDRLPRPVACHLRISAWCRGCNRVLPRLERGACAHCHRPFDRADRKTFLREPREPDRPSLPSFLFPIVVAVVVYTSAWWLDGWVVKAIWLSERNWPMASMAIIWVRTVVVVAALLYPIRLTRWDHFMTYWIVGGLAGGVLALPFGWFAMLPGVIAGMGAAIWTRWFTISAFGAP